MVQVWRDTAKHTTKSLIIINVNVNHNESSTLANKKHTHIYVPNHVDHWIISCKEKKNKTEKRRERISDRTWMRSNACVHNANPFHSYTHIEHMNCNCGCQSMRLFLRHCATGLKRELNRCRAFIQLYWCLFLLLLVNKQNQHARSMEIATFINWIRKRAIV